MADEQLARRAVLARPLAHGLRLEAGLGEQPQPASRGRRAPCDGSRARRGPSRRRRAAGRRTRSASRCRAGRGPTPMRGSGRRGRRRRRSRRGRLPAETSRRCRRGRTGRRRPGGSGRTRSRSPAAGRPRSSCSPRRRARRPRRTSRPRRTVRMSPRRCSHSGLSRRETVEHRVGEVDERHREARLEVQRVVAAAAAELEHLAHRDRCRVDDVRREGGLLGVLLRRRDQRPPRGEVAVEPRAARALGHQNAAARVPMSAAPPRITP